MNEHVTRMLVGCLTLLICVGAIKLAVAFYQTVATLALAGGLAVAVYALGVTMTEAGGLLAGGKRL